MSQRNFGFEDYETSTLTDDIAEEVKKVNWGYLFQPEHWYFNRDTIETHFLSFGAAFGAVLVAAVVFWFCYTVFNPKGGWYEHLQQAKRVRLSDRFIAVCWTLLLLPLGLSSWLVWVEQGAEWTRAQTVYSLHLLVNMLVPVSIWWVQDLSLALLSLLTLLIVAIFTTSQFQQVLYFASYINTPYLFFVFAYFVQFCYIWYVNEGLPVMMQLKEGKSITDILNSPPPSHLAMMSEEEKAALFKESEDKKKQESSARQSAEEQQTAAPRVALTPQQIAEELAKRKASKPAMDGEDLMRLRRRVQQQREQMAKQQESK